MVGNGAKERQEGVTCSGQTPNWCSAAGLLLSCFYYPPCCFGKGWGDVIVDEGRGENRGRKEA